MDDELTPAIERLQAKLEQQLDSVRKTKLAINTICEAFDRPPLYPDVDERIAIGHLRPDQFYGKPLSTCVRTILEMRGASNRGAATVNEIFDMLKAGGYLFETRDDENAKRGLRISLRKNSAIFHKLPNGQWGLLAWYPNAKAPKDDDDEESKVSKTSTAGPRQSVQATPAVGPNVVGDEEEEDDNDDDDELPDLNPEDFTQKPEEKKNDRKAKKPAARTDGFFKS